ncbi:hypothetical protein ABZS79_22760 [Streptomyces griseoloalbus]|uniref:hypothetical protein n=1 Tax=Streptomyces griseoloalbus TaxID=67303 RepID=UPI0033A7F84F
MNVAVGFPTSLIPAKPGTYVTEDSTSSASSQYEVIGWAVVVVSYDEEGRARTAIEPVFLYHGIPYTESGWHHDMKPKNSMELVTP